MCIYSKVFSYQKAGRAILPPRIIAASGNRYYQGKDRPRLIVLWGYAHPLYETTRKGTTFFLHTQTNSQKYCKFSIYGVFFAF
jgi:hypothetical protein